MSPRPIADAGLEIGAHKAELDNDVQNAELDALQPARALCRMIGFGAFLTGAVMVAFSGAVEATADNALIDTVVHLSNVKFMAAMWCVTGVIFAVGAASLHVDAAWRLLRFACIGISISAVVRLVEMVRLDSYESYGIAAAMVELIAPGILIFMRERACKRSDQ